jgi:2-polyprenyl-3-methyl-5-hydroxy-6-metoxy-1,4-benzoquinol methylase
MTFFPHDAGTPATTMAPGVDWEECDCPLCGLHDFKPLVEAQDTAAEKSGLWFAVVQCQKCGLCFTNPRPTFPSISAFYPASYGPHQHRRALNDRSRSHRSQSKQKDSNLFSSSAGRMLDFGCGAGRFLQRMHRRGWLVLGLDPSAAAVEFIRDQLHLPALQGSLPHPDLKPASFELITMWHALEHVHAPTQILREAHRLLVPGGKLHVAVPNIDSLPFRWFGSTWYGLDVPRHLTHFAPWTLHLMLERAGFRVGPIRMVRHSKWMRSSAEIACARSQQPPVWQRWLKNRPFASLATQYCSLLHQSDCMMVTAER